jgi:hypothetical protein
MINTFLRSGVTVILMVIIFYHHSPIAADTDFTYGLEGGQQKPSNRTICPAGRPADVTHFSLDTGSIILAGSAVTIKTDDKLATQAKQLTVGLR